ncbi:MAG: P44/Msp2 family outer membrane protein [Pseudomonadota bacterium]
MSKNLYATMACIAALTTPSFAIAQDDKASKDVEGYVQLSLGASILSDSDNSGSFAGDFTTGEGTSIPAGTVLPDGTPVGWTTSFDTGLSFGAAIGARYGAFRGELEFARQGNDVDTHVGVEAGGIALGEEDAGVLVTGADNLGVSVADLVADGKGDIRTNFLLANVLYDFQNQSMITPYIGGGIGVGFVDVDYSPSDVPIIQDNSTAFAYQAIAGVTAAVGAKSDLFLAYRYRATSDVDVRADLFAADFDIENRASIVEIGFRHSF